MRRIRFWLFLLIGLIGLLGGLYLVLGLFFTDFLVDLWWFRSLGYEWYFWQQQLYRYLILSGFTLLFFLIFFLNFWIASRYLGTYSQPEAQPEQAKRRYREVFSHFRQGSLKVYLPFSLVLAVIVAYPLYREWEAALLFLLGPQAGVGDPAFGKDISYYLFSLPIYRLLLRELFIALSLLFLGLALLYWLEKRVLAREERFLPRGARVHLNTILLCLIGVGVKALLLQQELLLYTEAHSPLFFGPGFVEMRVIYPLLWLTLVLLLGLAVFITMYLQAGRGLKGLAIITALMALTLGARYTEPLPGLTQKYIVKPNEISRESRYITWNIQATLEAYGLSRVETQEYHIKDELKDDQAVRGQAGLWRNIPVWDPEVILSVYKQLQELRPYYDFTSVDVDRYTVGDSYQQVFLAARELNLKELPPATQNWVNKRLKYTHGYGVVMTPAAQGGDEPMIWFIEDIPPRSDYGFTIEQPAIYYGLGHYEPAIAPNDSREVDYPTEAGHTLSDYQGRGGVPVNNLFRKLIFALYFHEKDIFFTTKTNPESRMLFRRNIVERIRTITPFLLLDRDPYLVTTPKGLYWIQDAYTTSDGYPCSQPYDGRFNYIRNAVKIVADAYHGSVDYYVADPRDPIIQAYRRIYPHLWKDLSQMPSELRSHLRYPKDLFDIQMSVYAKFHQTDPEIFYKQEDLWEFPEIQQGDQTVRMTSYYLTINLLDPEKPEFLLLLPMVPKGRANLRSLAVVGCDPGYYGKIKIFSFPKGTLVYGPSQVNAIIDQDTVISEQFTLWNQIGSQVERGKMLVLPVSGGIYHIQPVYLKAATRLKIPQLKRLIVGKGEMVVMAPSLEEGFAKLAERIQADKERLRRRLEGLKPEKQ